MALELTSQRSGHLTALYPAETDKWGNILWWCQCDCGKKVKIQSRRLSDAIYCSRSCPVWKTARSNAREDEILTRLGKGETLAAIGKSMKLTRERVRQIKERALQEGKTIKKSFVGVEELLKELHTSRYVVFETIARLGLDRRESDHHLLRFSMEEAEQIRRAIPQPKCVECQQPLGNRMQRICTKQACRKKYVFCKREELRNGRKPGKKSHFHEAVVEAIQGITDHKEFITHKEALAICGLTPIKIQWLAWKNVLTIQPHPTRLHKVTGKPERLYSRAEMEAIATISALQLSSKTIS